MLSVPVVYYRLKQKDVDGRFNYSQTVAITIQRPNSIVLYPNPVQEKANLTINTDKAETVQLRLIDNLGRILSQQQWNLVTGLNHLTVDVRGLAKGAYYIELKGVLINERKQFLKQ